MDELLQGLRSALADRYTAEREIGRGGMATVFLAEDRKHGRKVALKVLRPQLVHALGKERFLSEIQITARLDHPHILPLLDSGEAGGFLYFVMPYAEGETLRNRLERHGQLPVDEAMQIARELASALQYAHEHDVVHRDIKPANILLQSGHARLADFGIAHAVGAAGGERLTATGMSVGTPAYLSPEQALGERSVDARSDIYSLACVTYEMLAGAPPFSGDSTRTLLAKHVNEPAPLVTTLRPEAGKEVATALAKALAKAPEDRQATPEEFTADLVVGTRLRRRRRKRRPKATTIALGLAGMATIAVGGMLLGGARDGGADVAAGSIVFLPFAERGDVQGFFEGDSLPARLALMFRGTERYKPVLPRLVRETVATHCSGPPEVICGARVASDLGAQLYVHGTVTETLGDSVQVLATMVDATGEQAIPSVVVEGSRDQPWELLDNLYRKLAVAPATQGDRALRLAGIDTESPEALAAFLEGERLFLFDAEGATIRQAIESFERALQHDSTFALAWYRLAVLYDWSMAIPEALEAAARAEMYADRLSEHDRRMLTAHVAQVKGEPDVAEAIYQELIEDDPDDVEALFQLGYLYFAYNWRRGRSMAEAESPLRNVIEFSPRHPQASAYLFWAVTAKGHSPRNLATMDSLGGFDAVRAALRAIETGDSTALHTALDSMRQLHWFQAAHVGPPLVLIGTLRNDVPDLEMHASLRRFFSDSAYLAKWDMNRDFLRVFVGSWMYNRLAQAEAGRGRWGEARRIMRAMDDFGLPTAALHMTLMASVSPTEEWPVDTDSMRAEIESWEYDAPSDGDSPAPTRGPAEIGCQVKAYLLGLLSAHDGDHPQAREHARQVELCEPDSTGPMPTASRDLSEGLRAEILLREGRPKEALAALDRATWRVNYFEALKSPFAAGHREVFLRARVLQALGRFEEAIDWYAHVLEHETYGPTFIAPSYLYRGEASEGLGDREQAIWFYRAFLELWEGADPEYQYLADNVRERLSRLAAGSSKE